MKPTITKNLGISLVICMSISTTLLCGCTKKEIITGEVECAEIDVGVKIPGRISKLLITEGDHVTKEQPMGYLESKELEAKIQTVHAAQKEAQEQVDYAQKTFDRLKKLQEEGAIPKQQFDEANYKYQASLQKVKATQGQFNEVNAAYGELIIKAPLESEVVQIVARAGEIVSPGYPIITLVDTKDQWIVFHIREDKLKKIEKGSVLNVEFPAINEKHIFKVNFISALGSFARWKATNEQGSFDLKTFEIRARPENPILKLRPGMTARVQLP